MEFFDFVDGIKKDKDLRLILALLVKFFEYRSDDKFMHFLPLLYGLVVIFDSLQSHLFSQFFLDHFIDVELEDVLHMFFVEIQELFLHRG
jgi:hypothetical protein